MAEIRIILHGKAAGNAGVRTAVHTLRQDGHAVEVRVTWEPGDAAREDDPGRLRVRPDVEFG